MMWNWRLFAQRGLVLRRRTPDYSKSGGTCRLKMIISNGKRILSGINGDEGAM
jgi:hypothetical protein